MTALIDLKLYYFLDHVRKSDTFCRFFIFLHIWRSFARPQIKTLIVKFRLLSRKILIQWMFFPLINIFSNINYPIFWWLQQSCWEHPPTSYTTALLKWVGWKFWVWLFYKNMKDTFNEDLPYITYFVVFHPFLRRPQILLTFIRHLTLRKIDFK